MKPSDIKVGKTYRNRGKGQTVRTVLAIDDGYRPVSWFSPKPRPDEPGVLYSQEGKQACLYLGSFASWAGSEFLTGGGPPNRVTRDGSPVATPEY